MIDRDGYWAKIVESALSGDREARWEIQEHVATQADKRHDTALLIDRETGETAYRHSERNVELPAPIVNYLAEIARRVMDGQETQETAFLSKAPKSDQGEKEAEIALRVRWNKRRKDLSVEDASKIVAKEYGNISASRVRRIAKNGKNRELADVKLDFYEKNDRAVPFPILHESSFG